MVRMQAFKVARRSATGLPAAERRTTKRAFTLVELLIVIVIISILVGFIFLAAKDAEARANERATQSLIQKLETGLNDRLEALLQNQPAPNFAHAYLATIYSGNGPIPPLVVKNALGKTVDNTQITAVLRAQIIATYDFIKSEMPDVFFVAYGPASADYPLNFAGVPYTPSDWAPVTSKYGESMLPMGHMVRGPFAEAGGYGDSRLATDPNTGLTYLSSSNPSLGFTGSGIFGASYTAAAGIYKNLGYLPTGYDAVDNDGNGLVDDWTEAVGHPPQWQPDPGVVAIVKAHLANHTHATARAEMLYAILVEGSGPWGSVFSRDQFTDKEVKDTDDDGLPEFVDAFGQPLQFFRWPVLYHSDFQKGQVIVPDSTTPQTRDLISPYLNVWDQRERDPLDENQQLTAVGWWSGGQLYNPGPNPFGTQTTSVNSSGCVAVFEHFFHRLTEPIEPPSGPGFWDLGGSARRAFFTKALILSSGQDQVPGVLLYTRDRLKAIAIGTSPDLNVAQALIANENNAMPFGFDIFPNAGGFAGNATLPALTPIPYGSSNDPTNPNSYDIQQAGQDDITNHNLQATGGIGGSGP
jgi:prepilin-type N-terminal cleavage/methylation domain-containing protein